MPQQKSRKIFFYIFLFFIIGTLNNKNLHTISPSNIVNINVTGLDEVSNNELTNSLNFLKIRNLFFLDEIEIKKIINSNSLIEKFSIFKEYPSTLNININKTTFLAQLKKNNEIFFLGSNGKLIKTSSIENNIPFIFGDFAIENFFKLKEAISESNFNYEIKYLFFFKSGRWDVETESGLLIKLPKENVQKSLKLAIKILDENDRKIKIIDLRQSKQVIINE